ncbi:MAG: tetratricopeptide repeat protein [Candidatus Thorarchaeota archaeon]
MPIEVDPIVEEGIKHFVVKDYNKALKLFNQAIKKDPTSSVAFRYKGITYVRLKNYSKAHENLDISLELDSNHHQTWKFKAELFKEIGEYELSIECYNEALRRLSESSPVFPTLWLEISLTHAYFKQFSEALECIENCLKDDLDEPRLLKLKKYYTDGLTYGNFYNIPVDYSPLLDLIPMEQEIIYTTKMEIKWQIIVTDYPYQRVIKKQVITDVFFTKHGFASLWPAKYKVAPKYTPWIYVNYTNTFGVLSVGGLKIFLKRDPSYEAKEAFSHRLKSFQEDLKRLIGTIEDSQEDCPKCALARKIKQRRCSWCGKRLQ